MTGMPIDLRSVVKEARQRSPWHVSNEVLYALCRRHPDHRDAEYVIAKVLLIGRAYAAAIERRREVDAAYAGDEFYIKRVAPAVMASDLDKWIETARRQRVRTPSALAAMIETHARTTGLFSEISGLEKRSLASKYLHFHVPEMFFIYDARAVKGLRRLASFTGLAAGVHGAHVADAEYARFAQKCTQLSEHVRARYGHQLTPRELDNALLALSTQV